MNNYCRNCGEKLINSSVCEKCGTKVLTNRVGELNRVQAKKYIWIFFVMLLVYFISYVIILMLPNPFVYSIASPIISCFPLALIVFVIVAKKELKYSKFFNVVFWIMLLLIILFVLFILFLLISCGYQF